MDFTAGSRRGRPSSGCLSGLVGVKDQETLPQKGPLPAFPVWGGCSPPATQEDGSAAFLYIYFPTHIRFRVAEDGAEYAVCGEVCSCKKKEPIQVVKEKEKKT